MKALKINEKDYPIHSGYGTIILLGEKTGLEFGDLIDKFLNPDEKGPNDFFKFLADFTLCLIERGYEETGEAMPVINRLDVIDWLAEGNSKIILDIFIGSAPKFAESKNAVAPEAGQK